MIQITSHLDRIELLNPAYIVRVEKDPQYGPPAYPDHVLIYFPDGKYRRYRATLTQIRQFIEQDAARKEEG